MFTLLYSQWDPYKLCWKKKIVFLLKIFYFSICLTSNKLYWIEDKLVDVSTRFYTLASWRWQVDLSATWLDTNSWFWNWNKLWQNWPSWKCLKGNVWKWSSGEAAHKVCLTGWLSKKSWRNQGCTKDCYNSGPDSTENNPWCPHHKTASQTVGLSETWVDKESSKWRKTVWKIQVCKTVQKKYHINFYFFMWINLKACLL